MREVLMQRIRNEQVDRFLNSPIPLVIQMAVTDSVKDSVVGWVQGDRALWEKYRNCQQNPRTPPEQTKLLHRVYPLTMLQKLIFSSGLFFINLNSVKGILSALQSLRKFENAPFWCASWRIAISFSSRCSWQILMSAASVCS